MCARANTIAFVLDTKTRLRDEKYSTESRGTGAVRPGLAQYVKLNDIRILFTIVRTLDEPPFWNWRFQIRDSEGHIVAELL